MNDTLVLETLAYLVQEADRKNPSKEGLQLRNRLNKAIQTTQNETSIQSVVPLGYEPEPFIPS
jgi:hypothetical protein